MTVAAVEDMEVPVHLRSVATMANTVFIEFVAGK
jgi:hypothetical protein